MWSTSEECGEVISGAWNSSQSGTEQFDLAHKLAKCRDALKVWSKKCFGNNLEKIKELKTQLGSIQKKVFSEQDFKREKVIKEELEMVLLREEMYQHQRSRLNWIKYGDKNTSFFHATVNQRRQRNQISKIQDNMGIWLTEERDINMHLQSHFSSLFKSSGQRDFSSILQNVEGCITDGMNRTLTREVTDLEIKDAVFQLGALKSPGPDGFNGLFFQLYWDTVGPKVCKAVKEFFSSGSLVKDFNLTDLVLIPKVQFPETLSHMRAISLCNFYLKIITKILANRLKVILKTIISPQQSAFVPGRMIQDSILIAHEAFHFLKRKKNGKDKFMAVKLDFNKAYDRVEWDFLEALMRKLGFAGVWVGWVMETVASVKFSVLANGESRASISPERGLRQGDPLSPYLFLIVKDVLSKLIQEELRGGHLAGMRINKFCPILSHIFFADDAIIFLKAELKECSMIKSVLEKYCSASGQMVPMTKPPNSVINRVSDIIDPQSRQWNIQKLEKEVPVEVVNAVKEIPISHVERADQLVWHFNSNGIYSVKSGYHVAQQVFVESGHSKPSPSFTLGKDFWKEVGSLVTLRREQISYNIENAIAKEDC
ncbi:hypothetical protein RHSIM_Rhsim13G0172400 [Rhododendron simsii]|uniref:Reverse transcriptase domain-containing protein n=1 Tax=Rhododendron simsii TaxID=118357 RepID=A0A834L6G4_RHOSS|nr:hypothetical protein RHSIM_Rhsim13G0172400 [Rhododendron simsii]